MTEITFKTGYKTVRTWAVPNEDQWQPLLTSFIQLFNPARVPHLSDFTNTEYDPKDPDFGPPYLDYAFVEWMESTWEFSYVLIAVDPTQQVASEQWQSILDPFLMDYDCDDFEYPTTKEN